MIEEHQKRKVLPNLLLRILSLIIVVALVWMVYKFFDNDVQTAREPRSHTTVPMPATSAGVPAQVSAFVSFIRDNPAGNMMGLDHTYTSDGLRRLADAINATAEQRGIPHPDIRQKLDLLRGYADQLQEDRHSTDHANKVRDAFVLASDLMTSMERQMTVDLGEAVAEVDRAAEAIDPDKKVLDQKAEIEMFFKKMSLLLNEAAQQKS